MAHFFHPALMSSCRSLLILIPLSSSSHIPFLSVISSFYSRIFLILSSSCPLCEISQVMLVLRLVAQKFCATICQLVWLMVEKEEDDFNQKLPTSIHVPLPSIISNLNYRFSFTTTDSVSIRSRQLQSLFLPLPSSQFLTTDFKYESN